MIAKELEVEEIDVVVALEAMQEPVSIYTPIYNNGNDEIYLIDQIGDDCDSENEKILQMTIEQGIKKLNEREEPVIFLLWGSFARSKKELITNKRHKIIESVHPSPLSASRGFFGSKPFSKINNYLKEMNKEEIKW